jgi:hypothetical protein
MSAIFYNRLENPGEVWPKKTVELSEERHKNGISLKKATTGLYFCQLRHYNMTLVNVYG